MLLVENVVGRLAIERRVKIDKVNGIIWDILAQDFKVVAIVECIHRLYSLAAIGKRPNALQGRV